MSVEEAAEVLKISPQSVMRDWKLAKAWLTRELGKEGFVAKKGSARDKAPGSHRIPQLPKVPDL